MREMTPEKALESLGDIFARLDELQADIDQEAIQIQRQWEALGCTGGQRADHAAVLLGRLLPGLRLLSRYVNACAAHIEAMQRDPFGDEKAKGG